jgi:hypothetical protein
MHADIKIDVAEVVNASLNRTVLRSAASAGLPTNDIAAPPSAAPTLPFRKVRRLEFFNASRIIVELRIGQTGPRMGPVDQDFPCDPEIIQARLLGCLCLNCPQKEATE